MGSDRPNTEQQRRTRCASACSRLADTRQAVREAVAAVSDKLGGQECDLLFCFVSPDRDLAEALQAAKEARCNSVVGCTTAGELTEAGLSHGSVCCFACAWGDASHTIFSSSALDSTPERVAAELIQHVEGDSRQRSGEHAVTVLLGDGLSPGFEKLTVELRKSPSHQLVGGGAADEGLLRETRVGAQSRALEHGLVAVHIVGRNPWGVGVAHGLAPSSSRMLVTRASGNTVYEIDREPALRAYEKLAREQGLTLSEESTPQFLVENELGVLLFEEVVRVRAPIRVLENGALFFAGEVPEGSAVRFVHGGHDAILAGAREAATMARAGLGNAKAAGVLVFSCVCRGMVLKERYGEEIAVIREVFPGVPIGGFSSYGEIALTEGKLDGYHNNTIVVAAIPAGP